MLPKREGFIKNIFLGICLVIGLSLLILPYVVDDVPFLWSIVVVFLFTLIILLVKNQKVHVLIGFALFMMSLRFFYDMVVFPIRGEQTKNVAAYAHSDKVLDMIVDEDLVLSGR